MRLAAPMAATTVTGTEIAEQAAGKGDERCEDHDPGHQRLGDAVGQSLGIALAGLLGLDNVDDPGQ